MFFLLFFPINDVAVYTIMAGIKLEGSFPVGCVVDRINGSF